MDNIFDDKNQISNAIINTQPMPDTTPPQNQIPTPDAIKNAAPASTNKDAIAELIKLSPEDTRTRDEIYTLADEYEKKLKKFIQQKIDPIKNEKGLEDFKEKPYKFLQRDLENSLKSLKNEIGRPGIKPFRIEELKKEMGKIYHALDVLEESYEKGIPLKLDRSFTESQIKLPNGVLFDTEKSKDLINAYFGQNNAAYLIKGVMQRKNEEYILVATDNDTLIEVPMTEILNYYKKANTAPVTQKEVPVHKTPEYEELKKIIAQKN